MRTLRIIAAMVGKQFRILSRMPAILLVLFVPGIVMYSVFTKIFEGPAGRPFCVAVVDLDQSDESRGLIDALQRSNLDVVRKQGEDEDGEPLTAEDVRSHIRSKGHYRVALVIPKGYSAAPNAMSGPKHHGVDLIFDETQPMEADAIQGMLQMAAGRRLFEKTIAPLVGAATQPTGKDQRAPLLVDVHRSGVSIQRMMIAAKHTFLAGIVPMFLLFGATGAARGLLDELQSGEFRRVMAAPVAPAHMLISGLIVALTTAMIQCYSMYLFAWLVFDVAIWEITAGLFVLTLVVSAACTGFGIMLGALCRTSQHLDSIGTIVILAMSAIGGSMVPRFVMPPFMQSLGLFTINGWAYDGFIALIRNEGWSGIATPCLVLAAVAIACLSIGCVLLQRRVRKAFG